MNATIELLGKDFWAWREATVFRSADDMPRIAHPPLWLPRFDAGSVRERRTALTGFVDRWRAIDASEESVADRVDHRLIGSAIARVHWELEVTRSWQRDAVFAASQILGPYFDLLLQPAPFDAERQAGLVNVLRAVPAQVLVARANLEEHGTAELATVAAELLGSIESDLAASVAALSPDVSTETAAALAAAIDPAAAALAGFAAWLEHEAPAMPRLAPVGRESFEWYLRHVALIAASPEQLVAAAEQEYSHAVAWELASRTRPAGSTRPAATSDEQHATEARDETAVREFYESRGILSQAGHGHYLTAEIPAYLRGLTWLGVPDDLTDEHRLGGDGTSYMPAPDSDLGYFYAANALDPRLGIVHEGAHFQQLVRAWGHERVIRRRYYDSAANEGIAHYNEELMMQAGLFDGGDASLTIVHNFVRLRALRVVVDVNLAIGAYSFAEAVDQFVRRVPMDAGTATEETAMYLTGPGLAMAYTTGKLQLLRLLADAAERPDFDLRAFHDSVWKNGNLPFSLQRWELLGDDSEIRAIDAAGEWRLAD
ncbi:hypothetical protein GCM10027413_00210 [Conyzicola nivalis]|uniref:DUF885 domain-containing protein n=1 Tax=Conyzicola nivalis TaxID=1477021 RepID=A0A916SPZ5_9MICO|nr:DUF885 family protein [Conyzicola nivalis]GGB10532.1 hypothetical protein GCM10010979_26430 [Conyzicola nivalis]